MDPDKDKNDTSTKYKKKKMREASMYKVVWISSF